MLLPCLLSAGRLQKNAGRERHSRVRVGLPRTLVRAALCAAPARAEAAAAFASRRPSAIGSLAKSQAALRAERAAEAAVERAEAAQAALLLASERSANAAAEAEQAVALAEETRLASFSTTHLSPLYYLCLKRFDFPYCFWSRRPLLASPSWEGCSKACLPRIACASQPKRCPRLAPPSLPPHEPGRPLAGTDESQEAKAKRSKETLSASETAMRAANEAEAALIRAQEAELDVGDASAAAEAAAEEAEAALAAAIEAEAADQGSSR